MSRSWEPWAKVVTRSPARPLAGIGFATANLDLDHELVPPNGVYVTLITLLGRKGDSGQAPILHSVTNIGHRPTIAGDPKAGSTPVVEVHILDFEGDIYGERAALEFVEYLRPEQRFGSIDALKDAIRKDVEGARMRLKALD